MCDVGVRIDACASYLLLGGVSVLPIGVESKRPAIEWKQLIDEAMPVTEWPGPCSGAINLALITGATNGYVVVDCDTLESAQWWYENVSVKTPLMVKTRRGMHFYYRHPGEYVKSASHLKIPGTDLEYDIKGDRSYVLLPPSVLDGYQYQFVVNRDNFTATLLSPDEIPEFQMRWRPETIFGASSQAIVKSITDGAAYISKIRAIQGKGGDRDTFRAACKLLKSGLSESESLAALVEWNQTNAEPAWSVADLLHKVRSASESMTEDHLERSA